jgi:hypothetical protein
MVSVEGRKIISATHKGKPKSKEQKQKISDTKQAMYQNGFVHPRTGAILSEETKRKIGQANSEKVWTPERITNQSLRWRIVPPTGEPFEIENLAKWCRENNMNQGNMHASNATHKCKGYYCVKIT